MAKAPLSATGSPRLRVLIVDDNFQEARWLRGKLLNRQARSVDSAGDGKQALSYLKRHHKSIDLIISEWTLPGMSGAKLFAEVRKQWPSIPFLIVTWNDKADSVNLAKAVGMEGYYLKPLQDMRPLREKLAAIAGGQPPETAKTQEKVRAAEPERKKPEQTSPAKTAWKKDPGAAQGPKTAWKKDQRRLGAAPAATRTGAAKTSSGAIETAHSKPQKRRGDWDLEIREEAKANSRPDHVPDIAEILDNHELWLSSKGRSGERANLDSRSLAETDLSGRNLKNASFRQCDLSDSNLCNGVFEGADFRQAVLSGSDMTEGAFGAARLRHARLDLCNLQRASLCGADLAGATLRAANLTDTDFTDANFLGIDLTDVDLNNALGLTQRQIDAAKTDGTTLLPPMLRANTNAPSPERRSRKPVL